MHTNSIDYNEDLDQILICSAYLGEIFIIDHSTTIEEAAGHTGGRYGKGGDLLYRWGNPQNYRAGNANDQKLRDQHDARWVEPECPNAGHITIYNTNFHSVDEIVPPIDANGFYPVLTQGEAYGPDDFYWRYSYSNSYGWSGAQRLPNGNTCIAILPFIIVVTPEKKLVWIHITILQVWKIEYYPLNYTGVKSLPLNLENAQSSPSSQYNTQLSSTKTTLSASTSSATTTTTVTTTSTTSKSTSLLPANKTKLTKLSSLFFIFNECRGRDLNPWTIST
jgi:hypothetical protein